MAIPTLAQALQGHVYTSRYQNVAGLAAVDGEAVRITLGHPRWKVGYPLTQKIAEFAPERLGIDNWAEAYEARLDRLGPARALHLLYQAYLHSFKKDLVLMCFEDVAAGQECHRRVLAGWLERETGLVVPELGAA